MMDLDLLNSDVIVVSLVKIMIPIHLREFDLGYKFYQLAYT